VWTIRDAARVLRAAGSGAVPHRGFRRHQQHSGAAINI